MVPTELDPSAHGFGNQHPAKHAPPGAGGGGGGGEGVMVSSGTLDTQTLKFQQ